ncbi:hypothetical protein GQ607_013105 [Colletotrichum asianum]|uniref:Uncharacterized protein n=1 Tax=Colletotrichum asianum TaxID=702518 RepID=A0A8H3W550_9PEZI|nr:hypothetical protein GQ607_013105 [Colletotrichum asianum]
MRSKLIIYLR